MKKNLDNWKFPKIPVDQIYKKRALRIFPSYAIKDFKQTITLKSTNQDISFQLLNKSFLEGFVKKQHKFLHLGLVQLSIKSLMRDGLGAPIIVCLRDGRHLDFNNSLLAIVESNLSEGPFYFNCFPSFSVSLVDTSTLKALTLNVKTGGVPLALTYRVVCKAMVGLSSKALEEPAIGETMFFRASSRAPNIIKWEDIQVPESWTHQEEPQALRKMNSLQTGSFRTYS